MIKIGNLFEGIIPPMLTPFDDGEAIGENRLRNLVNFLIEGEVNALYPCGSMGEFSNMSTEEIIKVEEIVTDEANKKVPILAGTGASGTKEAVERTRLAEEIGVDGIINVTPYYLESDQIGIEEHYSRIAESTSLPVMIYHIPQHTGQALEIETIVSLDEKYENIVGIKDSSGDLMKVGEVIRKTKEDFMFFQGQPKLLLPTLLLGGDGGVLGTANVHPEFSMKVFEEYRKGNLEQAKKIQLRKVNPLAEACSIGPFPASYKRAARATGLDLGSARCPIRSMNEKEIKKQEELLRELELIDG